MIGKRNSIVNIIIKIFNPSNMKDFISNELDYMFRSEIIGEVRDENGNRIKNDIALKKISSLISQNVVGFNKNSVACITFNYRNENKVEHKHFLETTLNKYLPSTPLFAFEVSYSEGNENYISFFIQQKRIKENLTNVFIDEIINKQDSESIKRFIDNKPEYMGEDNEYLPYYQLLFEIFNEERNRKYTFNDIRDIAIKEIEDYQFYLFVQTVENLSIDVLKRELSGKIKKANSDRKKQLRLMNGSEDNNDEVSYNPLIKEKQNNFIKVGKSEINYTPIQKETEEELSQLSTTKNINKEVINKETIDSNLNTENIKEVEEIIKKIEDSKSVIKKPKITTEYFNSNELSIYINKVINEEGLEDDLFYDIIDTLRDLEENDLFKKEEVYERIKDFLSTDNLDEPKEENNTTPEKQSIDNKVLSESNTEIKKDNLKPINNNTTKEDIKEETFDSKIAEKRVTEKIMKSRSYFVGLYGEKAFKSSLKWINTNGFKIIKDNLKIFNIYKNEFSYKKYEEKVMSLIGNYIKEQQNLIEKEEQQKEIDSIKNSISNIKEENTEKEEVITDVKQELKETIVNSKINELSIQLESKNNEIKMIQDSFNKARSQFDLMLSNTERLYNQIIEQKDIMNNNLKELNDNQFEEMKRMRETHISNIEDRIQSYERMIEFKDEMIFDLKTNTFTKEDISENYVHKDSVEELIEAAREEERIKLREVEKKSIKNHVYFLLMNETSYDNFPEEYYFNKTAVKSIEDFHKELASVDVRILQRIGLSQ